MTLSYILGLKEISQNSKVLIQANDIKNTLLDSITKAFQLSPQDDFETIFSLLTTWNNRLLFLRLLESMLLSFKHIKKPFLDIDTLQNFTDLNTLFFDILALKKEKRKTDLQLKDSIPYLNSSLFDKTELEKQNNEISKLDSNHLAIFKHSILKKDKEYKDTQSLPLLEYLFKFLHAYDFTTTPKDIINHTKQNHDKLINAAVLGLVFEKLNGYKEGSFYTPSFITSYMCKESLEKVVKQNHDKLINAAVLGLVFEKLNGYKEGSFYTPSFITSYMCKESLEKVVIDKFNTAFNANAKTINELPRIARDENKTIQDLRTILFSIKICDPSVGSGHFLVSALNELVLIAYRLGILESLDFQTTLELDNEEIIIKKQGKILEYTKPNDKDEELVLIAYRLGILESLDFQTTLELDNEEIIIKKQGKILEYTKPNDKDEPQHKIQQELFNLKKEIIESCLFGVDINPNSCEITKLRLWIELLKYSFYIFDSNGKNTNTLETLPNIDINIKCGNSLVSNIALDMTKESLEKDLKNRLNNNATLESANEILSTINDIQNKLPHTIQDYKDAVNAYKNETNAELKSLHKQKIHTTQSFIIAIFHKTSKAYQNFKNALSSYLQRYGYNGIDNATLQNESLDSALIKSLNDYTITSKAYQNFKNALSSYLQRYGYNGIDNATLQNESLDSALIKSLNDYTISFNFHKSLDIPKESQGFVEKELITLIESMREYENFTQDTNAFEWRFAFPEVLDSNGDFLGFDLVIGNPPYIRQEEIKHLKPQLQKAFRIYKGTSDIYTYFYEQGHKILKHNGILSFITSNKYCRAGYGEPLREFLLEATALLYYIELNGIKVFDSASVDTSILSFIKTTPDSKHTFDFAHPKDYDTKANAPLQEYITPQSLLQSSLTKESFIFQNSTNAALKAKIEAIGTPLKEWDISINYGIKTGYNEAFIIDSTKRDEILRNCASENERQRTSELIKPILRGRDIKRYSYEWAGLWIIGTFPALKLNIDDYPALRNYLESYRPRIDQSGEKGCRKKTSNKWFETQDNIAYYQEFEKEKISYEWAGLWIIGTFPALKLNIDDYPALRNYLESYRPRIDQSGEKGCRKKTSHKWFETQDQIAYHQEFAKEKIVWNPVSGEYFFTHIKETMYFNNSLFMMTDSSDNAPSPSLRGSEATEAIHKNKAQKADSSMDCHEVVPTSRNDKLLYILGLMNSTLYKWLITQMTNLVETGKYAYGAKDKIERLPIPKVDSKTEVEFIQIVQEIVESKKRGRDTKELESTLDTMVCKLYNLSDDEIRLVESMGGGGGNYSPTSNSSH